MADSEPVSTTVPVKATEPAKDAPPTLAEPASGPVAEMSGALQTGDEEKPAVPTVSKIPSHNVNINTTGAETSSTADDLLSQSKPSVPAYDEDVEMNDAPAQDLNATPDAQGVATDKKTPNGKRKSTGGVPEHKSKKLGKKKSMPKLTHLDAKPGEYYFARLKSYPPWPSIICDEDMLPTTLINTRPITTAKSDGTYSEAYADGGKKVTDRTFPVMFLYTNEFAWIPNTDLTPLEPSECKDPPQKGKAKALLAAYEVAAEGHELAYFKEMLAEHANALQEDQDRKDAREAEKAAKVEKKKRKSEAKAAGEDTEMVDAEPKKTTKKRKKDVDDDEEQTEKPVKTPKTTKIKLTTNKTPATSEKPKEPKSAKAKSEKKKKKASNDEETADAALEEAKPLNPIEEREARQKEVLFLRHKLQKGFLTREQSPREDEMPQMSNFIKKLEAYPDLEVSIIRATKINKVLKALLKLNTIPRDEEFQFRKRSVELLSKWNKVLGAEPVENASGDKEKASPATNGVHDDKEKSEERSGDTNSADEKKDEGKEPEEKKADPAAGTEIVTAPTTTHLAATSSSGETAKNAVTEESKTTGTVPVIEKAPESASAAAQVQEVVKSTE